MADTATREKLKAPEEPQAEQGQDAGKKSKGFPKKILVIGIMQVALAAAAFIVVKAIILPRTQAGPGDGAHAVAAEHREPGQIHLIDNIIVNPAGTNGTRYLSTSIGLEVEKAAEMAEKMEELTPIMRDILIAVLSSKTLDDLSSSQAREQMRVEIQRGINAAIAPEKVIKVYFVDYVLQ
jgi:flagellar FliL protein